MKTRSLIVVAGLCVGLAACSSKSPPSSSSPSGAVVTSPAAGSGDSVAVKMADFSFDPSTITASTSQKIVLTNTGSALHNFTIEGTPVDVDVAPGQTMTLDPPGPSFQPGTYQVFCKYHKSSGMVASLNATA